MTRKAGKRRERKEVRAPAALMMAARSNPLAMTGCRKMMRRMYSLTFLHPLIPRLPMSSFIPAASVP